MRQRKSNRRAKKKQEAKIGIENALWRLKSNVFCVRWKIENFVPQHNHTHESLSCMCCREAPEEGLLFLGVDPEEPPPLVPSSPFKSEKGRKFKDNGKKRQRVIVFMSDYKKSVPEGWYIPTFLLCKEDPSPSLSVCVCETLSLYGERFGANTDTHPFFYLFACILCCCCYFSLYFCGPAPHLPLPLRKKK